MNDPAPGKVDQLEIGAYTLDDDLIEATCGDGRARVRIYRPSDTVVVLGPAGKPDVELNLSACRGDGVPILKRRGGGCAVVLDPGNLVVSVALPASGFGRLREYYGRLAHWLIAGLNRVGIAGVCADGISDLVLDDRKVGGACIYRSRDLAFYSSTLLVSPDIDKVERYLSHPPREPAYRRGRSHREFMGTLSGSPGAVEPRALAEALERHLRPSDI